MIRPKALIFDYGNVLCQPQRRSDIDAMAAACAIEREVFETLYWQLRESFDRGDYDAASYWTEIGRRANRPLDPQQITDATRLDCESWSRPNDQMISWVRQVQNAGIRTVILSNMPLALREYLDVRCDWLNNFDHKVFSCDVQCIKPNEQIYRHCLELLQLPPEETLFLDDRSPNVEAALRIGMHGLVFATVDEAMIDLQRRFDLPRPNCRIVR